MLGHVTSFVSRARGQGGDWGRPGLGSTGGVRREEPVFAAQTGQEGGRDALSRAGRPSVPCLSVPAVSVWVSCFCLVDRSLPGDACCFNKKAEPSPPPPFSGAKEGWAVPPELGSHRAAHRCPSGCSQQGSAPGAPLRCPPPPTSGVAGWPRGRPPPLCPGGLGQGPCWPVAAPPPPGAASSEACGAHGAGPAPAGVTPAQARTRAAEPAAVPGGGLLSPRRLAHRRS